MIYYNKISRKIFLLTFPFLLLRYIFHVFFYYSSGEVKKFVQSDLLFVKEEYKLSYDNVLVLLVWAINYNPYFVSLFYYRMGSSRAYLCSFLKKATSEFNICCDELGTIKCYHPFSTILNAKKIGNNFVCRNNTTIGNINNDYSQRPVIGDNVELGANVVVFGNIRIGDNVKIGAGAVVNKDIPSNCVVVGNPFRIIKKV